MPCHIVAILFNHIILQMIFAQILKVVHFFGGDGVKKWIKNNRPSFWKATQLDKKYSPESISITLFGAQYTAAALLHPASDSCYQAYPRISLLDALNDYSPGCSLHHDKVHKYGETRTTLPIGLLTIDTQCDFLYTPTPKKEILINSNLLTIVPPDLFCFDITVL